jgi:hypothetical protein
LPIWNYLSMSDALNLGVLALVIVVLMWPAWQQPNSFWYAPGAAFSDLTVTHWPNLWFVAQSIRQWGQVPLWRPLIMGGAPFVGNPLSALFYPPNWLFMLFPSALTLHLLFALHLYGAGVAGYGLMRWSYRQSPFAALVTGLGYALTPKLIAHIAAGHLGLTQAYAWIPLTVWLLRSTLQRPSFGRPVGCGATLAIVYLADPRVAFYNGLLLGAYAVYWLIRMWIRSSIGETVRLARYLLVIPVMAALFAAVQIVPTVELMGSSTRSTLTLSDAAHDSLPWRYLIGFLIANRGGYHEWMTYLGVIPLGLAGLALWRSRERERWFWAGLAAVGLLFSLGPNGPLYPLVYRLLPALGWV